MAKIVEEMIIVKVSTLVKENASPAVVFDSEVVSALEEAISEMVGGGHVVEIIKE